MKFVYRFSHSVICKMTVSDEPPSKDESHIQELKWLGRLKPEHIAQYRQWILSTTAMLGQLWNEELLYGLGVSSTCTEIWAFEQGSLPS